MKQFVEQINKTDLTPNQYSLLYCLVHGLNLDLNFNPEIERRSLKAKGYIDSDNQLTEKCQIILKEDPLDPFYHADFALEDKQLTVFAAKLNRLYPLLLPSGIHGRCPSIKLLKDRLKAFMRYYDFDLDTIYEATDNYIGRCQASNFRYMKPLANFILKDGEESTLSLECEIIQEGRKHNYDKLI